MGAGIWLIIFVFLLVVGAVMTGIGVHEKIKHKDDKTPPGTLYEVLLYGGIALIVIGLIGAIWAGLKMKKEKDNAKAIASQVMNPGYSGNDGGPSDGYSGNYGGPPGGYSGNYGGPPDGYSGNYGGPPSDPYSQMSVRGREASQENFYLPLSDGRLLNSYTGQVYVDSNKASQQNSTAPVSEKKLDFELFFESLRVAKELKELGK